MREGDKILRQKSPRQGQDFDRKQTARLIKCGSTSGAGYRIILKEHPMKLIRLIAATAGAFAFAQCSAALAATVDISAHDIGGQVMGEKGPEAGVWIIAETKDLPTKYAKIVVTDDQGRFVIPELPDANYKVWVRGYGLTDSEAIDAKPGKTIDFKVKPAASLAADAQNYPGMYWYSLINIRSEERR